MTKLRYLHLYRVNLTGSFEHTFGDLRWLSWDFCPLKCLPSEFYPQKLVTLSLPRSNMRTMWALDKVGTMSMFCLCMTNKTMSDLVSPNCINFNRSQRFLKS